MKSFNQFIIEVNRPEKGSDEEKKRWDAVRARYDAMGQEDREARIIGTIGRDKQGIQRYGLKNKESRKNQQINRAKRLKDVDSDLSPEQKKRGDKKRDIIIGREKEHHHLTSIAQSAKEFKGLSPEERKAKREKDAEGGKFHGSDPRNLAQTEGPSGGSGVAHRGEQGYHSDQKPVGSGGSPEEFGSEKEILAIRLKRIRQAARKNAIARGTYNPAVSKMLQKQG